jgi:glycosyltransferase involved in cell wall biosynthesis
MRIIYDGGIVQVQSVGGINRYFANLIRRLPADFEPHFTTCRRPFELEPRHPRLRVHRFPRFRPQRVSVKVEKLFFGRAEDSHEYDLAHPTYYSLLSQREIRDYRCPTVITVWDMIHELFPDLKPPAGFIALKRRAIERADAVLCISENTKRDLIALYNVDEHKIWVTHLASDLDTSQLQGDEPTPSRPYFLYVGARGGYKNFSGLLSSLASAVSLAPGVMLYAVGPPFSDAEAREIAQLGLSGRVKNRGQVLDRELAALYRHSIAFIYPSLYEGFGIPPLEAMQCGTPVVAANRSSIPEVVGEAGILFDPERPEELTDILVALASDETMRESLITRGHQRVQQFSWNTTAEKTVEVYRTLVSR